MFSEPNKNWERNMVLKPPEWRPGSGESGFNQQNLVSIFMYMYIYIYNYIHYGSFQKWWYPTIDGLEWKILFKIG